MRKPNEGSIMKKGHIIILAAAALILGGCGKTKEKTASGTDATDGTNQTGIQIDMQAEPVLLNFSKEAGVYADEFDLTIEAAEGYTIYYTTDGSNPLSSDTALEYTKPIHIADRRGEANVAAAVDPNLFCTNYSNYKQGAVECYMKAPADDAVDKGTTIRAIGVNKAIYDADLKAKTPEETKGRDYYLIPGLTEPSANTYFIGTMEEHIKGITESVKSTGTNLAVMSITVDYDDLFDFEKGIYVKGRVFEEALPKAIQEDKQFKAESARKVAANYNQRGREWEREAHVEFYEANADGMEKQFSQDCGIRIQGNYSRSDLTKGFRLYARSEYGRNNFKYPVFGDIVKDDKGQTLDKFKTLILRAGGNCAFTSKYNDTFWQKAAKGVDCSTQASRACVVYLNGEYWGLYVLEEDYSDDYFEDHYGVKKQDVVLYKGDAETYDIGYKLDLGDLPAGETNVSYYYEELLAFMREHRTLEKKEDYDAFAKLVDPDSVMDYFAVEVWINNKWDWPGKNWSMWKTTTVEEGSEYGDGRWRFCLYDIEFGGVSGAGDAYANTIKEDNYKPMGLLDSDTKNPAVRTFRLLMTNPDFNARYCERLKELSGTYFDKENALSILSKLEGEYGPLFDQFFERFPNTGSKNDALYGGYASSKSIRDFLEIRADHIDPMIRFCEDFVK